MYKPNKRKKDELNLNISHLINDIYNTNKCTKTLTTKCINYQHSNHKFYYKTIKDDLSLCL